MKLRLAGAGRRENRLATFSPGTIFGELALLDPSSPKRGRGHGGEGDRAYGRVQTPNGWNAPHFSPTAAFFEVFAAPAT